MQQTGTEPHAESAAHEADTLSVRGILWFVIFFVIANLAVLLIVWWMYVGFIHHDERSDVVTSALVAEHPKPPEPRLQPSLGHENTPAEDLATMRARENAEFVRREWMDRNTQRFAIPQDIVNKVSQLSAPSGGGR